MALSLLETKDCQISAPSQVSQLQQAGERPDERSPAQLTSVSQTHGKGQNKFVDIVCRRKNNSWAKVSEPQTNLEPELHANKCKKETPVKGERVSRLSGSIPKKDIVEEADQKMDQGEINQSEKPKVSKKRRQRHKGVGQKVIGLPCSPSAMPPVLLWFRRDLRLCDNPALIGSLEVGAPVIPVFIWSPEEEEGPGVTVAMGGACKSTKGISRYGNLCHSTICPCSFYTFSYRTKNCLC